MLPHVYAYEDPPESLSQCGSWLRKSGAGARDPAFLTSDADAAGSGAADVKDPHINPVSPPASPRRGYTNNRHSYLEKPTQLRFL